ncbi:MAG: DUF2497 domain-containing protein [Parvibaculaceae bacterium]
MGKAQTAKHVSIDELLASIRQAIHDEVEPPESMPSDDLVKSDVNRLKAAMERRNGVAEHATAENGQARRAEPPAKPGRAPMMPRLHRNEAGKDMAEAAVASTEDAQFDPYPETDVKEASKTLPTGKREGFIGILGGDVRLEEALARLSRAGRATVPVAEVAEEPPVVETRAVMLRPSVVEEEDADAYEPEPPALPQPAMPPPEAPFALRQAPERPFAEVAAPVEPSAYKPNGAHANGHAAPPPYVSPRTPDLEWLPSSDDSHFAAKAPPSFPYPSPRLQPDLLSPAVSSSASMAFDRLAEALVSRSTGGDRSLEDIARDLLRPLLKAWLDENLPSIVERQVREEIERVARRGGRG